MLIQKGGYVYILTSIDNTVLYTGVTSNLQSRILQHKEKFYPMSFTATYHCSKLVWFEPFSYITEAIAREKQIKGGSRKKKIALINAMNPDWKDLWEEVKGW